MVHFTTCKCNNDSKTQIPRKNPINNAKTGEINVQTTPKKYVWQSRYFTSSLSSLPAAAVKCFRDERKLSIYKSATFPQLAFAGSVHLCVGDRIARKGRQAIVESAHGELSLPVDLRASVRRPRVKI